MYLKSLLLRNFRNYEHQEISFSPSTNWIYGNNGQGKTNLLEALRLLSTGRSFRTHSLSELIAFDKSFFYIEGHFEKEGVEQSLKIYYDEKTRKIQYNQTEFSTFLSLIGCLPSILLTPEDLSLVSGPPAGRRRFLDLHLSQINPLYLSHLGRYFRALKHRNALLKAKNNISCSAWEQVMATSAEYLLQQRIHTIQAFEPMLQQWMQRFSQGNETIHLTYESVIPTRTCVQSAKDFVQLWEQHRTKEMIAGTTLYGPHRDDLSISLLYTDGAPHSAKRFSSEGQKRSCISSLRFAEWEQVHSHTKHPPIFGIDDFGIQLDTSRQQEMMAHLPSCCQSFLTSPYPALKKTSQDAHFHVINGTILSH